MTLRDWIDLARPPTLVASVVPVAVGAAAGGFGRVNVALAVVMLAVALLLQVATNMTNEYADFRRGVDPRETPGMVRVLVTGKVTARAALNGALAAYGAAFVLGLTLVAARGPLLLILGLLAIGAGFLYNAGPRPVSATPFGEGLVFLIMGPLEVLVSEAAVTGHVTWSGFWASLAVGCLVAAILTANNLRDRSADEERGRRTLVIVLGAERGRTLLTALVAAGLVWPLLAGGLGLLPWTAALPVVVLPLAVHTARCLSQKEALARAVPLVGRLHLAGGLLLAVGLLIR